jgi:hypothetical protein
MRAALGLTNQHQGLSEAYYLQQAAQEQQQRRQQQLLLQQRQQQQQQQLLQQQHLRQQELQRDLQLRQLLLQEQLAQQRQELNLRAAIGDQLNDFPDLQQHYQSLLMDDRLQRQRQNANVNVSSVGGIVGSVHPMATVQQQQQQQQAALVREQRLRAFEEQLLLQQRQQQLNLSAAFRQDDVVPPITNRSIPSSMVLQGASAAQTSSLSQQLEPMVSQPPHRAISQKDMGIVDLSGSGMLPLDGRSVPLELLESHIATQDSFQVDESQSSDVEVEDRKPRKSRKRVNSEQSYSSRNEKLLDNKKSKKMKKVKAFSKRSKDTDKFDDGVSRSPSPNYSENDELHFGDNVMDTLAHDVDMVSYEGTSGMKGTLEDLLEAAEETEHMECAAMILLNELSEVVPWPESEEKHDFPVDDDVDEKSNVGLKMPTTPAETIILPNFTSYLPNLPEEPLLDDEVIPSIITLPNSLENEEEGDDDAGELENVTPKQVVKVKKSMANEYPYPVDTWWPSVGGMRRERKSCGETSDEDGFEEEPAIAGEKRIFRANSQKIKSRLSRSIQPGVLEKLPHCRIHRMKTKRKKNSNAPELVYCWQVTELYPNELMVNCSECGTWRHAACGGHHAPFSVRENTKTPFVAVCENCHEEENFLKECPRGSKRVERQRAEQIRRGLATSTVMRYASYSKHGGTYKWPLGSVSATHIGGHTRSVQARHDKGEKQWNDMASRLYRGFGYRVKERVRSRTKELERLLIAIEDAEGFTDRHNMFVFLQRDTSKAKPAGFESEVHNIFDPADDDDFTPEHPSLCDASEAIASAKIDDLQDEEDDVVAAPSSSATSPASVATNGTECARIGCTRRHRYDSRFCSDGCGVSTLETSLLRALQDVSDLHPSILRHS